MKGALVAYGLCLFLAILWIVVGGGSYKGAPVDLWASKAVAFFAFVGCVWGWWVVRHEKKHPKPKISLDEQYAQAKADLDRMYLREHGTMPEWPEREEENKEKKENL